MTATVRLKQELGDAVELAFSPIPPTSHPDRALADALELLQRIAAADDKRPTLLLDEFEELAAPRKPYGDLDTITRQLRAVLQDSPAVTVLFAGSIEHAMRDLFGSADRALSQSAASTSYRRSPPRTGRSGSPHASTSTAARSTTTPSNS